MWPSCGGDPLAWHVTDRAWTFLLLLLSCSHLASDATPSIGRRRVACSCYAGAVFLARIAVLRRSGYPILLWDHFLGGFSLCFFPFGIPKVQKSANLVDFEKYCKMRLWLQNFVLIQPITSLEKTEKSEVS